MYKVILDSVNSGGVIVDADRFKEDTQGLRLYRGNKLVASFRNYCGVVPHDGGK